MKLMVVSRNVQAVSKSNRKGDQRARRRSSSSKARCFSSRPSKDVHQCHNRREIYGDGEWAEVWLSNRSARERADND